MKEKSQVNELDPRRVFTAKDSEIAMTRVTQCVKHEFEKLSDKEVYCPRCQSALVVNNINDYIKICQE